MKAISAILITLLAMPAMAGEISTGTYSSQSITHGVSKVNGVATDVVEGSGSSITASGFFNSRTENYDRDDSTVTNFKGNGSSTEFSSTTGGFSGLTGLSHTDVTGESRDVVKQKTVVDNNVEGTYTVRSLGASESGTFYQGLQSTTRARYVTETDSDSSTTTVYTNY